MKGLLLKDYYFILRQYKLLFRLTVLIIVIASVGTLSGRWHNGCLFGSFSMTILSLSVLNDDELSKWQISCNTFPISRKTFVTEKYLFIISNMMIAWLISSVLMCLSNIVWQVNMSEVVAMAVYQLEIIIMTMLVAIGIVLPLTFKVGYRKARLLNLIFFAVYLLAIVIITGIDSIAHFSETIPVAEIWSGIIVILCAISWRISVKVYSKREL